MAKKPKDIVTDVLTIMLFLAAVGSAAINALSKPPFTVFTWVSLGLSALSALVGLIIYFRKGRLEKSYQLGLEEGANSFLQQWATVAAFQEDGMDNAHRQLEEGLSFNPNERVGTEALDSYLKAIIATFKIFYAAEQSEFTASLAVINKNHDCLFLVKIEPGGRGRSNPLPRPYPLTNSNWGMVEAYNTDRIVYTPDVRTHGNAGTRGYLSVVNMPIKGTRGEVVAVVNVDSPSVDAFLNEERVQQVYQYCLPLLSSISLSLADIRVFRNERG